MYIGVYVHAILSPSFCYLLWPFPDGLLHSGLFTAQMFLSIVFLRLVNFKHRKTLHALSQRPFGVITCSGPHALILKNG